MIVALPFAVGGVALLVSILVCMVRLSIGPTAADRAVALDTINTLVVATMMLLGAAFDEVVLLDVALVYALLSYVGTLFIARYLEGGLD
ncbi:Subunit MbhB of membrane-bound energy-converting [Ni,Fe]-hydrogenase (Na+/H+ antiporter module subunit) [Candidatus Bipolaricaulis anaerobius]|uniref:Subunit MbhB of membrane-bound energy-converting [Ni,Fe]-hydrogenase (Na+/H+ antiporter module subunit) n=1 Tax=Candidatus Bipolaricaulis anaerobius TaxID=2026885 RepID=A0A2X3K4K0_9BACT|nr:monovalent cation/H+ antiporter complex subunit F [Candidatus Bipolaricaulis anaerobius]SQD92197.1 Subunit MbhB of membrane-bound energy-converting [Ni,Fe]-hydrogenase (Na+/H+ antiporter module subunit) [Candidatus Bipolaricaulis anaerobius]